MVAQAGGGRRHRQTGRWGGHAPGTGKGRAGWSATASNSKGHSSVFKVRASPVWDDMAGLGCPQTWKSQLPQDMAAWLKPS